VIYTKINQMKRYKGIMDSLDTAIDYLLNSDLTKLQPGRNEVDGDEVFVNCFNYTTIPEETAIWEGHKYYADFHVVLEGEEKIGVTDVTSLTAGEYDEAGDFIPYDGPVDNWMTLRPGDILVVFPEDAHMVKVQLNGASDVKKAVFKVRV